MSTYIYMCITGKRSFLPSTIGSCIFEGHIYIHIYTYIYIYLSGSFICIHITGKRSLHSSAIHEGTLRSHLYAHERRMPSSTIEFCIGVYIYTYEYPWMCTYIYIRVLLNSAVCPLLLQRHVHVHEKAWKSVTKCIYIYVHIYYTAHGREATCVLFYSNAMQTCMKKCEKMPICTCRYILCSTWLCSVVCPLLLQGHEKVWENAYIYIYIYSTANCR